MQYQPLLFDDQGQINLIQKTEKPSNFAGWLYLLHFDEPLHHAQHYLGSTKDPPERLARHLAGHGAHITQVLQEKGITWRLAALWQITTPNVTQREIESMAKKQRNGRRLCPICNQYPRRPKHCVSVPANLLKDYQNDLRTPR